MSTFSEMLYNLRINAKESQESVAEAIGVSRVAYTRYENGTREPKGITIVRIAHHFNVSTESLFMMDEPENTPDISQLNNDELQFIKDYRSLNKQGKDYMRQTMAMAVTIYKNASVPSMEKRIG